MKIRHGLSLLIFISLTVFVTWPLILHPVSLTVAAKDEFHLSYLMNWNIYSFTSKLNNIFQVPFFHPLKDTLAFSDPLFTSSFLALPLVKIFQQPFLAYSFNVFLAFISNGFFTYLAVYQLSKNWSAGLISGILFSFSVGRIDTLEHLQVLMMYLLPLGIYCFLKFTTSRKNYWALLLVICWLLQIFNTVFLGYVYIFALSIFALIYFWQKQITKKMLLVLIKYFILALVIVAIIFQPYLRVARTWQAGRSLNDVFSGSSYLLEYFYPTQNSRLADLAEKIIIKHPWPSYLGAIVSILGLLSIIKLWRLPQAWAPLSIFFTGLVMSFGPYFQLIKQKLSIPLPLPYWFTYYLIPGFKSMRVPQRWSHLALLGLALLIGLGLSRWFKKLKPNLVALLSVFIIALVIGEIRLPLFSVSVPVKREIPAVYQWLVKQPASIVLELPIQTWVMPLSGLEIKRLYYHSFLLAANHAFINGYSSFEPPAYTKEISIFRTLPPNEAIDVLNNLGVNLLIVHWQEMNQLYQKDQEALPLKSTLDTINSNYSIIYTDENTTVFQI